MNRYITMYIGGFASDNLECYTEDENWKDRLDYAEEWVWQYADSKKQALANHEVKFDQWQDDNETTGETKDTY